MRVGFNPNRFEEVEDAGFFHQVIVPVYIPHFNDYFKDSFSILKLCLESLFRTSHKKTYFTIINNGSCDEVVVYLNNLHQLKKIHTLTHSDNIGKINAIFKGLTGHSFKLITITDADVLFLNNWQEEAYKVFQGFPKAGTVCPTPSSKSYSNLTANILRPYLFSKKLKFTKVENPEALRNFAKSIGNEDFYNSTHLDKILTINENRCSAVIGAGHFVSTYRSDIFKDAKLESSNHKMGKALSEFLDVKTVEKGLWRLSTMSNYAYHMGNVEEAWMADEVNLLEFNTTESQLSLKPIHSNRSSTFRDRVFNYIFKHKSIRKRYLVSKGLTKQEAENY